MAVSSGYIYDNSRYIDGRKTHRNVPVFFNHGTKDWIVKAGGCCHEPGKGCNIHQVMAIAESKFCHSIHQEFEKWLRWNQCDDDIHFDDIAVNQLTTNNESISCAEATRKKHGCAEPTKLCIYESGGHGRIGRETDIRFMVEALCAINGGEMEDETGFMACRCPEESAFGGLFCISPKKSLGMMRSADIHKTRLEYDDNNEVLAIMIPLVIVFVFGTPWLFCSKRGIGRRTQSGGYSTTRQF